MKKNYFIKSEYIHKSGNTSIDENREDKNYWNKNRLKGMELYQHNVYEFAKKLIKEKQINSVVDVGCGGSLKLMNILYPVCNNVTGIDQKKIINYCNKRYKNTSAKFIVDDFENPKNNLGKYGLIISSDVIEHLDNPDILLDYIKRLSHKNSIIVISTPERDILRGKDNKKSPKLEHLREWNQKELKNYLEYSGFKVIEQNLSPALRFSFQYPFVIEYFEKLLTSKLNSNQIVVCRIKK